MAKSIDYVNASKSATADDLLLNIQRAADGEVVLTTNAVESIMTDESQNLMDKSLVYANETSRNAPTLFYGDFSSIKKDSFNTSLALTDEKMLNFNSTESLKSVVQH